MMLTRAQRAAITHIGRHRRTSPKVGKGQPVSKVMINKLMRMGLVMKNGKTFMLTYLGERQFTRQHPHSKYTIN